MHLAILLSDTDWTYTNELNSIEEEFNEVSNMARAEELKKMTKTLTVHDYHFVLDYSYTSL